MNSNQNIESQEIKNGKRKNEFVLDIPSTIMFDDGQYELTNQSANFLFQKLQELLELCHKLLILK